MTTTDSAAGMAREGDAPAADKPTVELPADAANWRELIADCDRKIKDLEEVKQIARGHLEQMLGENEVGTIDGQPIVRWSFVESTRLDSTKLKKSEPEVWARYARTQVSRRFTLAEVE